MAIDNWLTRQIKKVSQIVKLFPDWTRSLDKAELSSDDSQYQSLKHAVIKFLKANGHDLCHENRKELAAVVGFDLGKEPWPLLPSEREFESRCCQYRQELYGTDDNTVYCVSINNNPVHYLCSKTCKDSLLFPGFYRVDPVTVLPVISTNCTCCGACIVKEDECDQSSEYRPGG